MIAPFRAARPGQHCRVGWICNPCTDFLESRPPQTTVAHGLREVKEKEALLALQAGQPEGLFGLLGERGFGQIDNLSGPRAIES
jgi:hypothetical protein